MEKNLLPLNPSQETQGESMCGPASLKMVLDYYGVKKTEAELAKLCETTLELGTKDAAIKKAAESLGFKVEIKNNSSLEDIKSWLDKKVPVIVDWFTRGTKDYEDSDIADGHYSVVAGLDEIFIYLQDPEIGSLRTFPIEVFRRIWFDFRGSYLRSPKNLHLRRMLVIHP